MTTANTSTHSIHQLHPTAQLRVGGPVIVKWPADNPSITKVAPSGEYIGIWTDTGLEESTAKATFMVLQDIDEDRGGELVGETDMPWFGRCRVFLMDY